MAHSTVLLLNCISIVLVYLQAGSTTATTGQPNWPDGTYALPKPLSGCPDTWDQFTWEEGWRYQETESTAYYSSKNYFSSPLHLAGYFGKYRISTGYCVKTTITDSGTQWPNGSYCIAKKGECPEGFGKGYIYWDDEDNYNDNFHHGILPDGQYNHNTRVDYCCRNDTHPSNEIVLPTNEPFFLLRMHQDGCQLVKDTTVLMEYVFWDEEYQNYDRQPPHPYEDGGDEGNRLYFCYYYRIGNKSSCSDGEIRLMGGDNLEGRVEICFDGVWGTVCHSTSTKTTVPATKTHLQSDLRSTRTLLQSDLRSTRTQVDILPSLNAPNTQSSDSSASSLLPAVLGTLSVLVVIIAASVCVVAVLIIVRRKRRKDQPQNLSPAHNINNPIYGGKTLDNDYIDGNKLQAEIQNREPERTLVNPIYGSDSQPSSTMQEISSSVHMYEGIDMGPSETGELNEPQNYEVPIESAQANYEVPIESAQAHYEDIPSGDVDTGDYSTLNTSGQYAILTPAILQPPRGHTTADEDYSLVEYMPPDNDTDEYSQLQHM